MSATYPMPQWGITMEEGTITEWVAVEGQQVSEGEVLAVVGTDKIDVEFESPADGVVAAHLVPEGETVACGTPVIVLANDQDDLARYRAGEG